MKSKYLFDLKEAPAYPKEYIREMSSAQYAFEREVYAFWDSFDSDARAEEKASKTGGFFDGAMYAYKRIEEEMEKKYGSGSKTLQDLFSAEDKSANRQIPEPKKP